MKKKSLFKIIATYFMHIILMLLMIVPSLSWLGNTIEANLTEASKVQGSTSDQAYFGGGDGSIDNPYIISDRIHLYNMAWLQYIGFFNLGPANNGRAQNYFKVTNDIDMANLAIPAIGTNQYPFMGHFDGQGYVINKCVTANASEILKNHPEGAIFSSGGLLAEYFSSKDDANNVGVEATPIIGFFGVVGDYGGELTDLGTKGALKDPSSEEDLTPEALKKIIYTAEIGITNFGLYDYSIHNNSKNTLVGLIAGYVNATVSNCKAGKSTLNASASTTGPYINTITENISDHLLVGHCTTSYKGTLNVATLTGYVPTINEEKYTAAYTSAGGANGWGGSVDINSLYNNIRTDISSNTSAISNYVYQRKELNSSTQTVFTKTSSDAFYTFNNSNKNEFNMVVTSRSSLGNFNGLFDDNSYLYITGGHKNLVINYESDNTNHDRFTIAQTLTSTDADGNQVNTTNYLNISTSYDSSIVASTNASNATYWAFDNTDDLSSEAVTSGHVFTVVNNIPYYLNVGFVVVGDQQTLKPIIGNTAEIEWTRIDNTLYTTYGSANYYLHFDGSDWSLYTSYFTRYIKTTSGDNYLSVAKNGSSYSVTNATSQSDATVWYFETPSLSGTIYTIDDAGQKLYLSYSIGNGLYISSSATTSWKNNGNTLKSRALWGLSEANLNYNSNTWRCRSIYSATALTFVVAEVEVNKPNLDLTFTDNGTMKGYTYISSTENLMFPNDTYNSATYIPLQLGYDSTNNTYSVLDNNTGYITSGSWEDESSATLQSFPYRSGDIRISQYTSNNLTDKDYVRIVKSNSDGSYTFTTIPVNGFETDENYLAADLQRYSDSVKDYQTLIAAPNLYGIHFMDGRINMDSLVTIPSAKINGTTYYNYQVPADCISFSFKEKGYVNFFAGTYYSYKGLGSTGATDDEKWNDSFFSFHRIIRNSDNTIKEIREILNVYECKDDRTLECYYKYKDINDNIKYEYYDRKNGVYVDGLESIPSNYIMTFDMEWIKNPNQYEALTHNAAYYFEVPASPGEYALGSAEGRVGGYLLYLDIAANAQEVDRTVIYDYIEENSDQYNYAKGVEFAYQDGTFTADTIASIILNGSYKGEITINRTGDVISITGGNISSTGSIGAVSGVTIDGITSLEPPYNSTSPTIVTRKVTIIDYNSTTKVTTKIVLTKVGNAAPTAQVYVKNEGETEFTLDSTETGKVLGETNGNETSLNTPKAGDKINWDYTKSSEKQFEYTYKYTDEMIITNDVDFNINSVTDADTGTTTTTYDYDITIKSSKEIVVTVTEIKDSVTVTNAKGETSTYSSKVTFFPTNADGTGTTVSDKGDIITIVATPSSS